MSVSTTIINGRGDAGAALAAPAAAPASGIASSLADRYRSVRAWTHTLCEPLVTEDYVVRTMPDVSPTKWHIAHTSWFFETFVLAQHLPGYRPLDPRYSFLFNSYYVQAGERHCRAQRGFVTRPTVSDVLAYRAHVDEQMLVLLAQVEGAGPERGESAAERVRSLVELGLHHEQQHQELILTDIKHVFWMNPLRPAYLPRDAASDARRVAPAAARRWLEVPEGVHEIGHAGDGFAFDNEGPRHRHYLRRCRLASALVTNGDYLEFMADGGYRRPELWLSAGWDAVRGGGWEAPMYWERGDGGWTSFTLAGSMPVTPEEPVCHVSYFEADAFARWAGARLPTEAEWEVVAGAAPADGGTFAESRRFHPAPPGELQSAGGGGAGDVPRQLFGETWQWTASPYARRRGRTRG
jgi:ergothioneine biosynthesis protein EgtB